MSQEKKVKEIMPAAEARHRLTVAQTGLQDKLANRIEAAAVIGYNFILVVEEIPLEFVQQLIEKGYTIGQHTMPDGVAALKISW